MSRMLYKGLRVIVKNALQCGNFSYAIRRHNNRKVEEIKDKFIKHWNEKHRESMNTVR